MQELSDILRRHRSRLVDEVTAQVGSAGVPGSGVDQDVLRTNLEQLFDDLIEHLGSGTRRVVQRRLHDRLDAIASRNMTPGAFPAFMRASFITIGVLRKVVESEGADFAPLEPFLVGGTLAAGDAYAAAYEARLLELQQQRLSREAEADRLRAVSHLVMGVAHELNTPLEIINQAADLVARDGDDDVREAVQLIHTNVSRASRLIRQFRGLSVSETADTLTAVDVASVVDDAVTLYRRSAVVDSKLDIRVIDQLRGDLWQGYPLYFAHVLSNLLSNAEHHAYRDAGGAVEIVLARAVDRLHVTVADQGVGISQDDLNSVLHPFFTTGRGRGRTGLGMAVVYNLVTAGMHGTLDIDSEVGVGTRLLLDLPWGGTS